MNPTNRKQDQTAGVSPSEEELARGLIDEQVPEDDRIIGRAFSISSGVIAVLALVGVATWLVMNREPEPVIVEEAPQAEAQSLSEAIDASAPVIPFTDITREAGIAFRHTNGAYGERLLPETMGGGVAFLDYNNDGHADLLFVDSRQWPWRSPEDGQGDRGGHPVLYRNDGTGQFTDVSAETGLSNVSVYGMGVAVADIDSDGYRDLFISAVGSNRLLRNIDGQRFEDITESAGVAGADDAWSSSSAFFDADNDGDLDLFVCNYVEWSREIDQRVDYRLTGIGRAYGPPTNYAGTFSQLYRNDEGVFTDVSAEAGIQITNPATDHPAGKALAVLPVDIDEDGWMDLVVANDTVQNFYLRNLGNGHFEESGMVSGLAFDNTGSATGAMGLDVANFSGSDETAIAVGNFANEMTSFYVTEKGNSLFTDQAIVSGVGPGSRQALSFGLFFFDADLDGRLDLLQTNGHVEDEINVVQPSQHYEQPTQLFWNCGSICARHYQLMEDDLVGDLARPVVGRGAAYADIDSDGDLDMVITQVNRRPLLLRNDQLLGHSWLRVKLVGAAANRDAIGARIRVHTDNGIDERMVMPTRSYLSQMELPVTFGLGNANEVKRLEVRWPDGSMSQRENVPVNQFLVIESD